MFSGTRFVKKPENCLSRCLQHFTIKRCRFSTLARTPSLKCHRKCKIYSDTSLELIEFDIGTRFLFGCFSSVFLLFDAILFPVDRLAGWRTGWHFASISCGKFKTQPSRHNTCSPYVCCQPKYSLVSTFNKLSELGSICWKYHLPILILVMKTF